MIMIIDREDYSSPKQIIGTLYVFNGFTKAFECKTLELPDKNNQARVSSIPAGVYIVEKRWSEKYGDHFHVKDVEGRSWILIHYGNYYWDTLGCILAGAEAKDINRDGHLDVTNSKATMEKLNQLMPEKFVLYILK